MIAGMLLATKCPTGPIGPVYLLALLVAILFLHNLLLKRILPKLQLILSVLILFTFIQAGQLLVQSHNLTVANPPTESRVFLFRLLEPPTEKNALVNLRCKIISHPQYELQGLNAIIKIHGPSTVHFQSGSTYLVKCTLKRIEGPKNLYGFDYAAYMALDRFYVQGFAGSDKLKLYKTSSFNLLQFSQWCEEQINAFISLHFKNKIHQEFLFALILGNKQELNARVKQQFISTGSMHVLAVSGLHLGAVYLLFSFILKPFRKRFSILTIGLTLIGIWTYALITGLGPPVLRAAIMISLVVIGKQLQREPNVYHVLILSAVVQILFDPAVIFKAGFQFSYLALLSILIFYRRIDGMLNSKYYVLNKLWSLAALGISAQLLSLPLSLYYFRQFPSYFIISNILVVPYVVVCFYSALAYIFCFGQFAFTQTLTLKLVETYLSFSLWINEALAQLPHALIQGVQISAWTILAYYALIYLIFKGVRVKIFNVLGIFTALVILVFSQYNIEQDKIVVYGHRDGKIVLLVANGEAVLFADVKTLNNPKQFERLIEPVLLNEQLKLVGVFSLELVGRIKHDSKQLKIMNGHVFWNNLILYFGSEKHSSSLTDIVVDLRYRNYIPAQQLDCKIELEKYANSKLSIRGNCHTRVILL